MTAKLLKLTILLVNLFSLFKLCWDADSKNELSTIIVDILEILVKNS